MVSTSLLGELRQKIKDVRHSVRGLSVAISDETVTTAVAEVTGDRLIITISGGSAPSIDFDLTNPRYDTVGKLYDVLSRISGYAVQLDEDAEQDHPAIDIRSVNPVDIRGAAVELVHRLFSDLELEQVLSQAVSRHNPSFTTLTVPEQENVFVLTLAHALVCRIQASDVSKRRGLATSVDELLKLADNFDAQYAADTTRLARAIVSPKEASPNNMQEGDIVLGHFFRASTRTGFQSPLSQNLPPTPPELYQPDPVKDLEDTIVVVRWARNRDFDFYTYELWMDTRPDVVRNREGLIFTTTPFGFTDNDQSSGAQQSTSKMVFRSFGANSNSNAATFATFVEEFGQEIKSFRVSMLEPETTYYFKLFVGDMNYENEGSNVIKATTKPLRVKFAKNNYANALSGTAGDTVILTFDDTMGALPNPPVGYVFRIGGKEAALTWISAYSASFVIPSFVQTTDKKDLSIQSPTNLVDVKKGVFKVNA